MKRLSEKKQEYLKVLENFALKNYGVKITMETPIDKLFPLKNRFRLFNELDNDMGWYLPDFKISPLNIFVRISVLIFTLALVATTFMNFIFYAAINSLSAFLGVLVFCIVFPFSTVSFFFPTYIKKSGFGNIKTVDDFIDEIALLNQNPSRKLNSSGDSIL